MDKPDFRDFTTLILGLLCRQLYRLCRWRRRRNYYRDYTKDNRWRYNLEFPGFCFNVIPEISFFYICRYGVYSLRVKFLSWKLGNDTENNKWRGKLDDRVWELYTNRWHRSEFYLFQWCKYRLRRRVRRNYREKRNSWYSLEMAKLGNMERIIFCLCCSGSWRY